MLTPYHFSEPKLVGNLFFEGKLEPKRHVVVAQRALFPGLFLLRPELPAVFPRKSLVGKGEKKRDDVIKKKPAIAEKLKKKLIAEYKRIDCPEEQFERLGLK